MDLLKPKCQNCDIYKRFYWARDYLLMLRKMSLRAEFADQKY
jgi:hypothetical protein